MEKNDDRNQERCVFWGESTALEKDVTFFFLQWSLSLLTANHWGIIS